MCVDRNLVYVKAFLEVAVRDMNISRMVHGTRFIHERSSVLIFLRSKSHFHRLAIRGSISLQPRTSA